MNINSNNNEANIMFSVFFFRKKRDTVLFYAITYICVRDGVFLFLYRKLAIVWVTSLPFCSLACCCSLFGLTCMTILEKAKKKWTKNSTFYVGSKDWLRKMLHVWVFVAVVKNERLLFVVRSVMLSRLYGLDMVREKKSFIKYVL